MPTRNLEREAQKNRILKRLFVAVGSANAVGLLFIPEYMLRIATLEIIIGIAWIYMISYSAEKKFRDQPPGDTSKSEATQAVDKYFNNL